MREIHTEAELVACLEAEPGLRDTVVQGVDLSGAIEARLHEVTVAGAAFLGCALSPAAVADLVGRGALVFPELGELPFDPYRGRLYTADELFTGFDPADECSYCATPDAVVYRHWAATGRATPGSILEALGRRLHDHAISDALEELLADRDVVAIMGGHSMARGSEHYAAVAGIAGELARAGFLIASGGGPGAMEASHLGAYFADRDAHQLGDAIDILARAPLYSDRFHLARAFDVRARFGPAADRESVGIPTWFYGHEPPNIFASHIAKYFANSVREEGLLSIARRGILFAPGSAGTVQEIFQDAAQNHYGTIGGTASPMAFLGVRYWTEELPVVPLLERLSRDRPWSEQIVISDDPAELVDAIASGRPVELPGTGWSYCAAYCAESSN